MMIILIFLAFLFLMLSVILLGMSIFSFKLLFFSEEENNNLSDFIIKVIGHQWYWSYEYSDLEYLNFDSYMKEYSLFFLLETDNFSIFSSNSSINLCATSSDVIHSWALPSYGVKIDVFPGRLNFIEFFTKSPGFIMGQCSEICGINHSMMPIMTEIVML